MSDYPFAGVNYDTRDQALGAAARTFLADHSLSYLVDIAVEPGEQVDFFLEWMDEEWIHDIRIGHIDRALRMAARALYGVTVWWDERSDDPGYVASYLMGGRTGDEPLNANDEDEAITEAAARVAGVTKNDVRIAR